MKYVTVAKAGAIAISIALTGCTAETAQPSTSSPTPSPTPETTELQPNLAGYIGGLFGAGAIAGGQAEITQSNEDDLLEPSK